jgi:hypothetical protein
MRKRKWLSLCLLAIPCCLLAACAGGAGGAVSTQAAGADTETAPQTVESNAAFTAEYRRFLAARRADRSDGTRAGAGGYQCTLEDGRLSIVGARDTEIWRSEAEWYVDSFRLGDVNGDEILDVVFVVWKSYRFGAEHPARMTNEDAAVRCHLFVYSMKDDRVKPLWCSSSLPRPIDSFELDAGGEQTPVLSGARLVTQEGMYTEDDRETAATAYTYAWSGWGFSPLEAPSAPAEKGTDPAS